MPEQITITRRFEFDAAHRVWGHEGKCQHLHGHRYVAEVTVTTPRLDRLNRVVDFSVIKDRIGKWIDANWDHNILLNSDDPLAQFYRDGRKEPLIFTRTPYFFADCNPTAEIIAECLYITAQELLHSGIPNDLSQPPTNPLTVSHVRIYETPNCWADYSPARSE